MTDSLREKLDQFDPDRPLAEARTIPSDWYFDPEIYRAECARVFGRTWQVAGRIDQIEKPGSYLTECIAGEPVVLLRDESGQLRAFSNVCRHRAAVLMNEAQGNCSKLRCRYHGWTYDLQGSLRGTPEFDGVADFRKEGQGLPEFAVDTWGGYVWVHFEKEPPQSLAEFLSPLPEQTASLDLHKLRFFRHIEYPLACNWKVLIDNFQDGGYHVNTVHPGLAGALNYAGYRTETAKHATVQISPMRSSDDEAISKVRRGDFAYYWWVFPNFMVNLYSGVMDTHWVLPLGPDHCKIVMDWYFPPFANEDEKRWAEESVAVSDTVQQEDVGICAEVQRGLKSRYYSTGRFSVKREEGVYHFHRLLHEYLM